LQRAGGSESARDGRNMTDDNLTPRETLIEILGAVVITAVGIAVIIGLLLL